MRPRIRPGIRSRPAQHAGAAGDADVCRGARLPASHRMPARGPPHRHEAQPARPLGTGEVRRLRILRDDSLAPQHETDRAREDREIDERAHEQDVPLVQVEALVPGNTVAPAGLREPGQAGAHGVPAVLRGAVERQVPGGQGARAHDAHVSHEDVPQTGQLIEAGRPQPGAEAREPLLVRHPPPRGVDGPHRAELHEAEPAPAHRHPLLAEQDGPSHPRPHRDPQETQQGREDDEGRARHHRVRRPLDRHVRRGPGRDRDSGRRGGGRCGGRADRLRRQRAGRLRGRGTGPHDGACSCSHRTVSFSRSCACSYDGTRSCACACSCAAASADAGSCVAPAGATGAGTVNRRR